MTDDGLLAEVLDDVEGDVLGRPRLVPEGVGGPEDGVDKDGSARERGLVNGAMVGQQELLESLVSSSGHSESLVRHLPHHRAASVVLNAVLRAR